MGCFILWSPAWRSTELPLNPISVVKPSRSHLQSTGSRAAPSHSPSLLSIHLNISVLKLPDVPFMTEITCLGTDTRISLKVRRIINGKINITKDTRRALTVHPPPALPCWGAPCFSISFQGYWAQLRKENRPLPGTLRAVLGSRPDVFLPSLESWVMRLGSGITHRLCLIRAAVVALLNSAGTIRWSRWQTSLIHVVLPSAKWYLSPLRQTRYCRKPLQPTRLKTPCKSKKKKGGAWTYFMAN